MKRIVNPFTIKFGGDPHRFFGREEHLLGFDAALRESGSDYRATFITGTRGFGKTSLLEQFSKKALDAGWNVLDTQSDKALQSLYRHLCPYNQIEDGKRLEPSISTPILGGSLGEIEERSVRHIENDDIDGLFLSFCEVHREGVCITIDEAQKTPLDELSSICGAFQMASRKGHNVILSIAGLPQSYDPVILHEGCTYLRRANHISLGLFSRKEAQDAFAESFSAIEGIDVSKEALEKLVGWSMGQPYMLQLLGYYTIESIAENAQVIGKAELKIGAKDIEHVFSRALSAYEQRMLKPLVSGLGKQERELAASIAQLTQDVSDASIGDVAAYLGKETTQLSPARDSLIKSEIAVSVGYGKIRLAIPYLRSFLIKNEEADENLGRIKDWGV